MAKMMETRYGLLMEQAAQGPTIRGVITTQANEGNGMKALKGLVLVVLVALLSACGTVGYTPEQRLERKNVGVNRDLFVVVSTATLNLDTCRNRAYPPLEAATFDNSALQKMLTEICPRQSDYVLARGFLRHHFTKGAVLTSAYASQNLNIQKGDIVEYITVVNPSGYHSSPPMITRVVRRDAFNTKDPSCYWDGGNSGVGTAFANGGVVCPAENYDWRNQKWADLR